MDGRLRRHREGVTDERIGCGPGGESPLATHHPRVRRPEGPTP